MVFNPHTPERHKIRPIQSIEIIEDREVSVAKKVKGAKEVSRNATLCAYLCIRRIVVRNLTLGHSRRKSILKVDDKIFKIFKKRSWIRHPGPRKYPAMRSIDLNSKSCNDKFPTFHSSQMSA